MFVLHCPMLSRSQILKAIRSAARKLGRAPTRAEFMRLTGIHYGRLIPHFPDGYRAAIRAAGLSPDPGGLRIGTAALLTDWARLARKKGRIPTREEYEHQGRYASASLETRFHRWSQVPAAFSNLPNQPAFPENGLTCCGALRAVPCPRAAEAVVGCEVFKRAPGATQILESNPWRVFPPQKFPSFRRRFTEKNSSPLPCSACSSRALLLKLLCARLSRAAFCLTALCLARLWGCPAFSLNLPMKWESFFSSACWPGAWAS